jgi:ParB-like chromosome segregation protein Spo0J|tara:strand:- start:2808 stop:3311 length:504 start_codon:yes stop_codon:yes gene_type:complete
MTSIKDLKSDHKNARKRTDRSATLIEESLKKYGAARSIVIDEDNRVLAGNGTIEGAKAAGLENVRVIETDGDEIIAVKRKGLTEDQKVGLALADNRASDLSAWDASMLHELGKEHDLSPWFETEDLVELMGDRNDPTVPQDFPEVDDELETEHRCPSCGYEWSGKTK